MLRWMRFLPLLVARGYEITVITPKEADYPRSDPSLVSQLPPGLKIIHTPHRSFARYYQKFSKSPTDIPYGDLDSFARGALHKRILLWIRLNLIIPDMRKAWNKHATQAATKLLSSSHYDLIVTTGPPHSTHLVGFELKNRYKTRWIADFRDPWTKIHYLQLNPPSYLARKIHSSLERKVIAQADHVLVVSQSILDELPAGNKTLLYNGFDATDFTDDRYQRSTVFRIKFIGQLTAGQDIKPLLGQIFRAFADKKFKLTFIGTNLNEDCMRMIKPYQKRDQVEIKDFVTHSEAIAEMVDAELLLLMINDIAFNKGIITTKLFEYIGSRTKILCIGPPDGEAAQLIRKYRAGLSFAYDTGDAPQSYLLDLYQSWSKKLDLKNPVDISPLSVQNQISTLFSVMESMS